MKIKANDDRMNGRLGRMPVTKQLVILVSCLVFLALGFETIQAQTDTKTV